MTMTPHLESLEVEAVTAREGGRWRDDSFLQKGECLACLEGGAWWILSHDGAVQQWLVRVLG